MNIASKAIRRSRRSKLRKCSARQSCCRHACRRPQPAQADANALDHILSAAGQKELYARSPSEPAAQADAPAVARERDDPELIAASNKGYAAGLRDGKALAAVNAEPAPADAGEAREPAAWVTPDGDRAITQRQKQAMLRDGGASASSVRSYSIRCYAGSAPADAAEAREPHSDDIAVDSFAAVMKHKLALARAKGRGGWKTCDPADLSRMLREHVEKGDPRDVANFCMMLWHHGSPIVRIDAEMSPPDEQRVFILAAKRDGFGDRKHFVFTGAELVEFAGALLNGADHD
ncbi:hypothetical protein LGN43_02890 [Burkholderia multivorans]|nr:hypothetical protein [Burkholderia multivorans]